MNFDNIKDIIAKAGSGALDRPAERRDLLKSFGSKVAVASLPFVAGALFNKAKAQTTPQIIDALNNALQIEHMQAAFYKKALEAANLIPGNLKADFEKIAADEAGHVTLISYLIDSLSGNVSAAQNYDFTGGKGIGGPFPGVFYDYAEFLEVAQLLKDTTVRAYKGLITAFIPNNSIMNNMINIHSVEARHSAHIRLLRTDVGVKAWVTSNQTGINKPAAVPVYAGENNVSQAGINITDINGFKIRETTATEAFDEPLIKEHVKDILDNFIST